MINARAETLTEKPAYRGLLGRHRSLVVADGFYEWTVGANGKKQPIHFHLPGNELFAFAGLSTARTDGESGEVIESCTIITTRPNELVAPVHDRMPVILPTRRPSGSIRRSPRSTPYLCWGHTPPNSWRRYPPPPA
jgi:putative SOS response-associated peptidase YedK